MELKLNKLKSSLKYICILQLAVTLSVSTLALGQDEQVGPVRVGPKKVEPTSLRVGSFFPGLTEKAVDGRVFNLKSASAYKATVVALTSTSCPVCKKYTPTLAAIEKQFQDKGVQFCFLNTLPSDKTDDIKNVIREFKLTGPYIHDKTDKWNEALDIRTTAEVFVFDSNRKLVYRGAVDDQYGIGYALKSPRNHFLTDALNAMIAGKAIQVTATTAPGCDIWVPKGLVTQDEVTYHQQISRIVQNRCVDCHREKGLAPFSLETVDDLVSHAGMIRTVIENGTMPPWFAADNPDSRWEFANDRSLSKEEKGNLLKWLSSNRPVGDPSKAPKAKKFKDEWNIKVDKEIQIPKKFEIKATGIMDYEDLVFDPGIEEDTWVQAVEIRPTDLAAVHHVLVFIVPPQSKKEINPTDDFFAVYVPGNSYQVFPPGFGKKIPAGSKLKFQMHYTPYGKKTTDQTVLGIQICKSVPRYELKVKGIANGEIDIPAGELKKEMDLFTVRTPIRVTGFFPHMHLRGAAFKYELNNPEQDENMTMLDVPQYDFNWQLRYQLKDHQTILPGSSIMLTATFDNTASNLAVPQPPVGVRWGKQTEDEMMIGYVEYYNIDRKTALWIHRFRQKDKDGNGKLTREELDDPELFNKINSNGDDHLTEEEVFQYEGK